MVPSGGCGSFRLHGNAICLRISVSKLSSVLRPVQFSIAIFPFPSTPLITTLVRNLTCGGSCGYRSPHSI